MGILSTTLEWFLRNVYTILWYFHSNGTHNFSSPSPFVVILQKMEILVTNSTPLFQAIFSVSTSIQGFQLQLLSSYLFKLQWILSKKEPSSQMEASWNLTCPVLNPFILDPYLSLAPMSTFPPHAPFPPHTETQDLIHELKHKTPVNGILHRLTDKEKYARRVALPCIFLKFNGKPLTEYKAQDLHKSAN
jgi:hypothetical protein